MFNSSLFFPFRVSSGSIVSGYGLDDPSIEVRSPAEAKDFSSSLCVQTGSGAHPASCTMGTGGPFPMAKRGRGVMLTTHPHLVPTSRMSRNYTFPPRAFVACSGRALAFFIVSFLVFQLISCYRSAGPYYPLGTTGTVPRA
jgi:hypothetical protein